MKRTIGYFTLLAAVVLIVCSASTLFWSAYEGTADPWQKWVQGTQIVAVIIWEAGAVIAITYCFSHGHKLIGYAGTILLILAMGYTLSEELRQQAGAQETTMAKRSAESGKLELVRSELDKAIARRDDLQKQRKLTGDQQDELNTVRSEIAKLKDKWEAQIETPHAVVAPGVALIARWTKLNIADSADLNPLIKMAFWTMARVFALPIAVFGISLLGAATSPTQAREAPKATSTPAIGSVAVVARPVPQPRQEYKPWVDLPTKPAPTDDTPPPADAMPPIPDTGGNTEDGHGGSKKAVSKVATAKAEPVPGPRIVINNDTLLDPVVERAKKKTTKVGSVKEWLSECSSQTPDKTIFATAKECGESYRSWCHIAGYHPIGQKELSRKMSAILRRPAKSVLKGNDTRAPRNNQGRIWHGLVIYHPSATPLRATA